MAQKLALQPGDPVFVIKNSMTMQGTPVLLSATVADKDTAKRLGCKLGASMLRILRVAYSFGDTPIEYRCSLLDSENHEYVDVTGGDTSRYG
ncbi:GntR family transcriptional regulator [Bordetella pertussis]|nr:GntR family transcriptional regulator [Bordetella pertussis]